MKIILLGATGRIGNATLKNLLAHEKITSIVALTRRPLSIQHQKLKNIIHQDVTQWPSRFVKTDLYEAEALIWALGIRPSLVKSYDQARSIEVDAPISAANSLITNLENRLRSGQKKFRFIYVSGLASERDTSRSLWFANDARKLKGETENQLEVLEKKHSEIFEAYAIKSGHVIADTGAAAIFGALIPSMGIKESELAMAMIDLAISGGEKRTLVNSELVDRGRAAMQTAKLGLVEKTQESK